jgi:uncharacterized protein YacL
MNLLQFLKIISVLVLASSAVGYTINRDSPETSKYFIFPAIISAIGLFLNSIFSMFITAPDFQLPLINKKILFFVATIIGSFGLIIFIKLRKYFEKIKDKNNFEQDVFYLNALEQLDKEFPGITEPQNKKYKQWQKTRIDFP